MMRILALSLLALLTACATPLPQIVPTGAGTFDVRYDRGQSTETEIDRVAQTHCEGAILVETQSRYDGFNYRVYRCPSQQGGS